MNPLKSFTLTWWQAGLLMLAMLALGLAIGSTWPQVFVAWRNMLVVLFLVPAAYLSYVWLDQVW